MVLDTPLPTKLEDFPQPVDTSSQVSTPDDAEMEDASLEEIPTASSPTAEAPEPSSDAAHLWEEANKALGELLVIKSSIDTHWQKLVWELGMALFQNDSKTVESIKEAKAVCAHSVQEAETHCSTAIREAEASEASQAHTLKLFSTLKKKLSKGRVRVNSTSSLPVKPPYKPALPIPQCTGSLLPHTAGTCANIPSLKHFPRSFPLSTRVCPWGSFPSPA